MCAGGWGGWSRGEGEVISRRPGEEERGGGRVGRYD